MNISQDLLEFIFHLKHRNNKIYVESPDNYLAFMDEFVEEEIINSLTFNATLLNIVQDVSIKNTILIMLEIEDQEDQFYDVEIIIDKSGNALKAIVSNIDYEEVIKF